MFCVDWERGEYTHERLAFCSITINLEPCDGVWQEQSHDLLQKHTKINIHSMQKQQTTYYCSLFTHPGQDRIRNGNSLHQLSPPRTIFQQHFTVIVIIVNAGQTRQQPLSNNRSMIRRFVKMMFGEIGRIDGKSQVTHEKPSLLLLFLSMTIGRVICIMMIGCIVAVVL